MKPQNIALLRLLRERPHTGVTALDAFQEIGTFRLAARVADLRADGFDIWTDLVTTESEKRIAVYRLREKRQVTQGTQISIEAWAPEELVMIANQSGMAVSRG